MAYLDPLLLVGGGPVVLLPLWRDVPVQRVPMPSPVLPEPRAGPFALPYAAFLAHLEVVSRQVLTIGGGS